MCEGLFYEGKLFKYVVFEGTWYKCTNDYYDDIVDGLALMGSNSAARSMYWRISSRRVCETISLGTGRVDGMKRVERKT